MKWHISKFSNVWGMWLKDFYNTGNILNFDFCVFEGFCVHTCVPMHICGAQKILVGVWSLHVGFRDKTQIVSQSWRQTLLPTEPSFQLLLFLLLDFLFILFKG